MVFEGLGCDVVQAKSIFARHRGWRAGFDCCFDPLWRVGWENDWNSEEEFRLGAMLPALVAGCVDVATVLFLRPNWFNGQDGPMLAQFVAASMVFSLQYFIPGIVTSMVGGLWIRQKGMALVEKHRLELRQDLELDIHQRT
jgi:hypothetical protein